MHSMTGLLYVLTFANLDYGCGDDAIHISNSLSMTLKHTQTTVVITLKYTPNAFHDVNKTNCLPANVTTRSNLFSQVTWARSWLMRDVITDIKYTHPFNKNRILCWQNYSEMLLPEQRCLATNNARHINRQLQSTRCQHDGYYAIS